MVSHLFLRTLKTALQSNTFFVWILIWILFCVWVKRLVMHYYENEQGGVKRCVGTWGSWRNKHFHSYGCWKQQQKDKWREPESKFLIAAIILTIIRIKALGVTVWSQPEARAMVFYKQQLSLYCGLWVPVLQRFLSMFRVWLLVLAVEAAGTAEFEAEGVWRGCRTRMESCEVFCLVSIFSVGTSVQQVLQPHITLTQKPEMSRVCTTTAADHPLLCLS